MEYKEIKNDIYWIGALDPDLRVFDIVMNTPYGTSYNSYLIKGSEKTAIIETVKENFFDEYIERLKSLNVDLSKIDYIIANHTEPDHAGSYGKLIDIAKNAKIVGSASAINFLKNITNKNFESIIVKDNDTISLGNKTLKFISAPFLHWPDTMYTYDEEDAVLFTCDSFGSHYCCKGIFNDTIENKDEYLDSVKHYFDCIVSPFRPFVLKALQNVKSKNIKIDMICPGHGPVLRNKPEEIVNLYEKWSTPLKKGTKKKIVISYVSAYGYTKIIAGEIEKGIKSAGDFEIEKYNVIESSSQKILDSIENADGLLFGSPTINQDALKPVMELLISMNPIVHGKKLAAAFGSYGWSGEAVKNIEERLKQLKMKVFEPGLKVKFKPSDEDLNKAFEFGKDFAQKLI